MGKEKEEKIINYCETCVALSIHAVVKGRGQGDAQPRAPGRAGGLHCRALLGLSPGRMLNPGGMLRPGGMLNPGGMLSPEGASIGGRAPLRDGDTRGGRGSVWNPGKWM